MFIRCTGRSHDLVGRAGFRVLNDGGYKSVYMDPQHEGVGRWQEVVYQARILFTGRWRKQCFIFIH